MLCGGSSHPLRRGCRAKDKSDAAAPAAPATLKNMRMHLLVWLLAAGSASGVTPCPPTPAYSPCEIAVELSPADRGQHPNPYLSVELWAEMRSPSFKTYRVPAFFDGARMMFRFAPPEAGEWTFRLTSNLAALNGQIGKFSATPSESVGFIRPANVHFWIHHEQRKPHLWVGDTCYRCAWMDRVLFESVIRKRAAQKFTHIRYLTLPWQDAPQKAFTSPDEPDQAWFRELDQRVAFVHAQGLFSDLILGGDGNHLARLFPQREQRERYLRFIVARYSAYNVTWQLVQEYEEYDNARDFTRELGLKLKELDYNQHPRTTHTLNSSAALADDGWMDYILYQSSDDALGAIEHQLYAKPQVNAEFGYEDSGGGRTHPHHVDSATFINRLWNATMNGQAPTFGNTGIYGGKRVEPRAEFLESPGAKAMTVWTEFFEKTRFWELEPYFDLDGGRALALPGVEYIVYLEKPGPVEMMIERHSYQVYWMNPATGETIKEKKDYKDHVFRGAPPHNNHSWVLHLSRDGRKQGMLRSYKFESRRNLMQEPERNPRNMPFELVAPAAGSKIRAGEAVPFEIRLRRETPGTRRMMYLITGEAVSGGQGFRYLGSGTAGQFTIRPAVVKDTPTSLTLRIHALNAPGKVYSIDQVFTVVK